MTLNVSKRNYRFAEVKFTKRQKRLNFYKIFSSFKIAAAETHCQQGMSLVGTIMSSQFYDSRLTQGGLRLNEDQSI